MWELRRPGAGQGGRGGVQSGSRKLMHRAGWNGCLCIYLFIFRAAPVAHGSSQARGLIGATAAGICHSNSNVRSEPYRDMHHISQQCWILNLLSEVRDQTHVLLDKSQVPYQ